eukprot:1901533-Amphidinium_carterae.1
MMMMMMMMMMMRTTTTTTMIKTPNACIMPLQIRPFHKARGERHCKWPAGATVRSTFILPPSPCRKS